MEKTKYSKRILIMLLTVLMLLSSVSVAFSASAATAISKCTVTVAKSVSYTGKALTPTVTVKNGKTTLKKDKHYTVKYSNNKNFGTAKVTVTAKKGSGYTGSKTVSFNIVPAKVSGLKATSTTSTITLKWNKVAGAKNYVVYSYNASKKKYTKLTTVSSNSATIKKLSAGKTYSYAVKAQAVYNKKTYVGAVSAVLNCATAPGKVGSVKLSSVKATTMTVSWNKVSGATGYRVYSYNSSTKKYTTLATVNTNKANLTKFTANTTYKITVKAYRKVSGVAYFGSYSAFASATTLPATVTGLKATATHNSVTLTWSKAAGANLYKVYEYNSAKKTYKHLGNTTATKYTISSLKPVTTYSYVVKSCKKVDKKETYGALSSVVTVKTKPAQVTGLKATATDYAVTLTWSKAAGAAGYNVYSYDASSKKYTKVTSTTGTKTVIYNLALNKTYNYCVEAYSSSKVVGPKSAIVKATTKSSDYLTKYQNIIRGGTFKMDIKMPVEDGKTMDFQYATKNGNVCATMDFVKMAQAIDPTMDIDQMESGDMIIKMYHDAKKNKSYALMNILFDIYFEFEKGDTTMDMFMPNAMINMLAPKMDPSSKVTYSSQKLSGKTHSTASYKTVDGSTCKYFFLNGVLVRIDISDSKETNTAYISNLSSSVSDSEVSLPKNFPIGWISADALDKLV